MIVVRRVWSVMFKAAMFNYGRATAEETGEEEVATISFRIFRLLTPLPIRYNSGVALMRLW